MQIQNQNHQCARSENPILDELQDDDGDSSELSRTWDTEEEQQERLELAHITSQVANASVDTYYNFEEVNLNESIRGKTDSRELRPPEQLHQYQVHRETVSEASVIPPKIDYICYIGHSRNKLSEASEGDQDHQDNDEVNENVEEAHNYANATDEADLECQIEQPINEAEVLRAVREGYSKACYQATGGVADPEQEVHLTEDSREPAKVTNQSELEHSDDEPVSEETTQRVLNECFSINYSFDNPFGEFFNHGSEITSEEDITEAYNYIDYIDGENGSWIDFSYFEAYPPSLPRVPPVVEPSFADQHPWFVQPIFETPYNKPVLLPKMSSNGIPRIPTGDLSIASRQSRLSLFRSSWGREAEHALENVFTGNRFVRFFSVIRQPNDLEANLEHHHNRHDNPSNDNLIIGGEDEANDILRIDNTNNTDTHTNNHVNGVINEGETDSDSIDRNGSFIDPLTDSAVDLVHIVRRRLIDLSESIRASVTSYGAEKPVDDTATVIRYFEGQPRVVIVSRTHQPVHTSPPREGVRINRLPSLPRSAPIFSYTTHRPNTTPSYSGYSINPLREGTNIELKNLNADGTTTLPPFLHSGKTWGQRWTEFKIWLLFNIRWYRMTYVGWQFWLIVAVTIAAGTVIPTVVMKKRCGFGDPICNADEASKYA